MAVTTRSSTTSLREINAGARWGRVVAAILLNYAILPEKIKVAKRSIKITDCLGITGAPPQMYLLQKMRLRQKDIHWRNREKIR